MRAISTAYTGSEDIHVELRARIVIEGLFRKSTYLNPACLNRGAGLIRDQESLPVVYTKYSDYYVSGQKITTNTIDYIYTHELHECSRLNTYMGLWQFAQVANVLNTPIQSVYPEGGDSIMRYDFNRIFYPLNYKPAEDVEPIRIMWTSSQKGCPPNHFVPLLAKKRTKYA